MADIRGVAGDCCQRGPLPFLPSPWGAFSGFQGAVFGQLSFLQPWEASASETVPQSVAVIRRCLRAETVRACGLRGQKVLNEKCAPGARPQPQAGIGSPTCAGISERSWAKAGLERRVRERDPEKLAPRGRKTLRVETRGTLEESGSLQETGKECGLCWRRGGHRPGQGTRGVNGSCSPSAELENRRVRPLA